MVLHLRLDLYARLAADPPSLVDIPITQQTRLCRLAQVIHREGRRGSSHPGVCGIGRHRQERSEEHTSELQSHLNLVCRLLLEKKKIQDAIIDDNVMLNVHI